MRIPRLLTVVSTLVAGFLVSLSLCALSNAAELKMAKINLQQVFKQSAKVRAIVEEIKKMQNDAGAKMNALVEDISKAEQKLKEGKDKLGKEDREKVEAELKKKRQELRSQQETEKIKISFKQKSAQNVVNSQLKEALEKIAQEGGYSVVLQNDAIVYSKDIPDLTDKVAKGVDALPLPEGLLKP
jgi:outer membrane protein